MTNAPATGHSPISRPAMLVAHTQSPGQNPGWKIRYASDSNELAIDSTSRSFVRVADDVPGVRAVPVHTVCRPPQTWTHAPRPALLWCSAHATSYGRQSPDSAQSTKESRDGRVRRHLRAQHQRPGGFLARSRPRRELDEGAHEGTGRLQGTAVPVVSRRRAEHRLQRARPARRGRPRRPARV